MEDILKLTTPETFAMLIAAYLLIKTTSSLEKLTEIVKVACHNMGEHITLTTKILEKVEATLLQHSIDIKKLQMENKITDIAEKLLASEKLEEKV
jgi:hypothetical protein